MVHLKAFEDNLTSTSDPLASDRTTHDSRGRANKGVVFRSSPNVHGNDQSDQN